VGSAAEFGGDAFRLAGFWECRATDHLTNGFAKKTQKTPEREMALAEQRRRDYLSRKKANMKTTWKITSNAANAVTRRSQRF